MLCTTLNTNHKQYMPQLCFKNMLYIEGGCSVCVSVCPHEEGVFVSPLLALKTPKAHQPVSPLPALRAPKAHQPYVSSSRP